MKIAVIGTGYVGLVTGTCLAEVGNEVTCVDVDEAKVALLKASQVPIYEPDLDNIFARNIKEGRLKFTAKLAEGIKDANVLFLALPTPARQDGSADLSFIMTVSEQLGPLLKKPATIVIKSTVPVGTADQVSKLINKTASVELDVVSNPEFLREGFAVADFMRPDRVIVGAKSKRAQKLMADLYAPFIRQGNPIFYMDNRSAEMTKYAANSFLAAKITFMNEIANLSELVGVDVDAVRLGIGADDRIGKRFLFPGIGYGGSCFPKDVTALKSLAYENGYDFKILSAVAAANNRQKQRLAEKIAKYYGGKLQDKLFAVWGLSFKPDTDDIREAPALALIEALTTAGARVAAYDPEAMPNVKAQAQNKLLAFAKDEYQALEGADALVITTEWNEFRTPDFKKIKNSLKKPVIFDGRNVYDLETMRNVGFYYESIGRPIVNG